MTHVCGLPGSTCRRCAPGDVGYGPGSAELGAAAQGATEQATGRAYGVGAGVLLVGFALVVASADKVRKERGLW